HLARITDRTEQDQERLGKLILRIPTVAKRMGLKGFKTIFNTGKEGGQMVLHLHAHILGGKIRSKLP
ncbi:HIT domain-containing protein, partial [Francisella tularensis]|uniref:HIT domain-containing protein n=1 Tax=Francisella tularensis TaxID=263 RepID=UPI002381A24C